MFEVRPLDKKRRPPTNSPSSHQHDKKQIAALIFLHSEQIEYIPFFSDSEDQPQATASLPEEHEETGEEILSRMAYGEYPTRKQHFVQTGETNHLKRKATNGKNDPTMRKKIGNTCGKTEYKLVTHL